MKKMMLYCLGLLASMAISLGFIFLILNWPGGMELFIGGIFCFILLYLPLLAWRHFESYKHGKLSTRLKWISAYTSGFLFAISIFFKINHLQFADIMLLLSGGIFIFGFLPFLFFDLYTRSAA
jgi:hypothetical protein